MLRSHHLLIASLCLPDGAPIMRLDRHTGDIAPITLAPSGGARPAISPDGEWMAYVADVDAMSGMRLRNLVTGADEWLVFPIDYEHLNRRTRFTFTPDGNAVVFVKDGTFHEVDILWIMDLPDGRPRPLIQVGGGQYQPPRMAARYPLVKLTRPDSARSPGVVDLDDVGEGSRIEARTPQATDHVDATVQDNGRGACARRG
jgi:hypothetical protein